MGFKKEAANLLVLNGDNEHVKGLNLIHDVSDPGRVLSDHCLSPESDCAPRSSYEYPSILVQPAGPRVLLGTGGSEE